jgi:competence protein ComEC
VSDLEINKKIFVVETAKENYAILKSGSLRIYVSTFEQKLSVGEYYSVKGELVKISHGSAPWEFDFNEYLQEQNINWKLSSTSELVATGKHNFRFYFYKWLNGRTDFEKSVFGQIKQGDAYQNLIKMSLSFIFNVSFLNFLAFEFLIRKIFSNKKNQTISRIVIAQLFLPFLILENFPITILKLYLLIMVNAICFFWRKPIKRQAKFSIIWMIELLINPWYIFNIGFIYISVCFILLKWSNDSKWWKNILKNLLISMLIFIPIQAFYDYKIFWTSSIYQLILAPITAISFLLSILGIAFPVGQYQIFINSVMNVITVGFVKISLMTIVGHFSVWFLIAYYVFLKIFLSIDFNRLRYLFLSAGGVMFLFASLYNFMTYPDSITMLNVGDGNSFIARLNGKYFLFDAGAGYGISKSKVKDYLVYYGINKVERIFLSHQHDDHINQVDAIQEEIKVKNISNGWDNYSKYIEDAGITFTSFVSLGHEDENANSMVTYFDFKGLSFLFTGDATNEVLEKLAGDSEFLKLVGRGVDFYQVPHHGSDTSDSLRFMETIKPRNAFISCLYQKSRPFPRPSVLDNLHLSGVKNIYITGRNNTYRFLINKNKVINLN